MRDERTVGKAVRIEGNSFHHYAVGRGAKWKCRISEERVCNLVAY
jgi:hypothetical protein